jgi:hypothetical protein
MYGSVRAGFGGLLKSFDICANPLRQLGCKSECLIAQGYETKQKKTFGQFEE